MTEGFRDGQAAGRFVTAGGDDDAVELLIGAIAERQAKSLTLFDGGTDGGGEADAHASAGGGGHQAVDDRRGVIGRREHASVFFGLRGHAASREPLDRVARLKAMERAEQLTAAAGIFLHQLGRLEAGVRDVAAPAARDADLGEEMGGRFEERDRTILTQLLGAGDRREEAGGSSAEDGDATR